MEQQLAQNKSNITAALRQAGGVVLLVSAFALLGAHFYRHSDYGMSLGVGITGAFAFARAGWRPHALALFLLFGVAEWLQTGFVLADARLAAGLPWVRAAAIVFGVALFTLWAAMFALKRADTLVPDTGGSERFQACVFLVCFWLVYFVSQRTPFSLLLLERYRPGFGALQVFLGACYAAWIAGRLVSPRHSRKTRRLLWLVFACVFFAQLALGLLGFERMLMSGSLHVPLPALVVLSPIVKGSLGFMSFLFIGCLLLAGRGWCSYLCYFGAFDALAAGTKACKPPSVLTRYLLNYGRSLVFALCVAVAVLLRVFQAPEQTALYLVMALVLLTVLWILAFSQSSGRMLHCGAFCPLGLVVTQLGRLVPWRVRVDTALCNGCGVCEAICKYSAINSDSRAKGATLARCTLCRDCFAVCGRKALYMYAPGVSRDMANRLFAGLAAVLHTAFLLFARV